MMSDGDLYKFLDMHFEDSKMYYQDNNIQEERDKAKKYYQGKPFGDKVGKDKSGIVTRDVLEAVEGTMPSLSNTFIGDDETTFTFPAMDASDSVEAEIVTAVINRMFIKMGGRRKARASMKDGLIQGNGFMNWYWMDEDMVSYKPFKAVTELEAQLHVNSDDECYLFENQYEIDDEPRVNPETGDEEETISGRYTYMVRKGAAMLDVVSPEEILINQDATWLDDAMYLCRMTYKSISDLRLMGFTKSVDGIDLKDLLTDNEDEKLPTVKGYNSSLDKNDGFPTKSESPSDGTIDESSTQLMVMEEYAKVDYDKDEVAELRRVIRVGKYILLNEYASQIPVTTFSPYPDSDSPLGLSQSHQVMDIQEQRSKTFRGIEDNMNLANNGRMEVVMGKVKIADVMDNRSDGLVRVKQAGSVNPIQPGIMHSATFSVLDVLNNDKAMRTGVSPQSQGLGGDELNRVGGMAADKLMTNLEGRIVEICHNYVPGFERLGMGLYQLVRENWSNGPFVIMMKGVEVEVDPSTWRSEREVAVRVGLGKDSNEVRAAKLKELMMMGAQIGAEEYTTPKQKFKLASDIFMYSGFPNVTDYISSPEMIAQDEQMKASMQAKGEAASEDSEMLKAANEAGIAKTQSEAKLNEAKGMNIVADNLRADAKQKNDEKKTEADIAITSHTGKPTHIS